jgi:hypothetical protein
MAIGQHQEIKPEAKDQKPARTTTGEVRLRVDKPAEPTLEDMLNKALKDNPDIKVAEAKVREAEAELNRVRLQVTQKVLTFHHTREAQKAAVKVAENEVARGRKLQKDAVMPQEVLDQMEDRLAQAKAKLAEIEAEMPYLVGQQAGKVLSVALLTTQTFDREVKIWDAATGKQMVTAGRWWTGYFGQPDLPPGSQPLAGTMLDKIRKALDTPVTAEYNAQSITQILNDLQKKVPDISFHILTNFNQPLSLKMQGQMPLRAALQLLEDTCSVMSTQERYSFAIREYGVLFTMDNRIPPGAIRLHDLQREKALAESDKQPAGDKK